MFINVPSYKHTCMYVLYSINTYNASNRFYVHCIHICTYIYTYVSNIVVYLSEKYFQLLFSLFPVEKLTLFRNKFM